jgi:hypothetical protein
VAGGGGLAAGAETPLAVKGFACAAQNHAHMVALYALWRAGIADRLWSMEDVVTLIDEQAGRSAPRLADRLVG